MHFPRVALGALLTVGLTVLACSDEDTIVAVNVASTKEVGYVPLMRVTITQPGQTAVQAEFSPQNDPTGGMGGSAVRANVDYRVTLPSGWGEGKATVELVSVNENGQNDLSDTTTIDIVPEEVTAAFLELKREMPMPMGGSGGTGGTDAGGTGGTAGSGGVEAGTGGVPAGGGADGAGTGGTDTAGTGGTGGS